MAAAIERYDLAVTLQGVFAQHLAQPGEHTVAFTPDGMEYLQEMLPQYKRSRSSPRS
jgi:hypothetical protein